MCGRAAQSQRSLASAQTLLQIQDPSSSHYHVETEEAKLDSERTKGSKNLNQSNPHNYSLKKRFSDDDATLCAVPRTQLPHVPHKSIGIMPKAASFCDNFNLSPGMPSIVYHIATNDSSIHQVETKRPKSRCNEVTCSEMIWGLCPRSGTANHPLPPGVSKHFENLMYNARSDTLYEKRTFRHLALNGNTCIWCIDGFFEWKQPEKNVLSNQSGKQPYFVYRKDGLPLVIPGLFTKVKTGRVLDKQTEGSEEEMLETFTHLTTAACKPLRWLHHRQPCFIWDLNLAMEWLQNPSEELVNKMSTLSTDLTEEDSCLHWHPVKKDMSKVSYRDPDSVEPIKIEKVASVKSFFTKSKTVKMSGEKRASKSDNFGLDTKKLKMNEKSKQEGHTQRTLNFDRHNSPKLQKNKNGNKIKTNLAVKSAEKKGSIIHFFSAKES